MICRAYSKLRKRSFQITQTAAGSRFVDSHRKATQGAESRFVNDDRKHNDGARILICWRPSEETRLRRPNQSQFVDSHLKGMQGRTNHDLLPQSRCLVDHGKTNASACITFCQKQSERKLTAPEARLVNCHWQKNPMALSLLV